ncbi:MAG: hypothetical protein ACLQMT_10890 [Candidatus Acidiferrales bacterium]
MSALILRSICVGIASVVITAIAGGFIAVIVAISIGLLRQSSGGAEVGWDLVTMAHNLPTIWILLPLGVFAIGFLLGFRYFSKTNVR